MSPRLGLFWAGFCGLLLLHVAAVAKPLEDTPEITPDQTGEVDAVGDVDGASSQVAKVAGDTLWIADWTFDAPDGSCDGTGWTQHDYRILNDGTNYWHIDTTFDGVNGITGKAAILSKHDLCWVVPTGYGNNWDYSIICKYRGVGATLSFNFVSHCESGFDYFTVEADSGGASESRVDYSRNPSCQSPERYRVVLLSYTGLQSGGSVTGLALPVFGVPFATHEVYLHFTSDGDLSDEDGLYVSHWGAGLVVDNISINGDLAYTDGFEATLNSNVTMTNTSSATPFGEWARLYKHITDNDFCTENLTCAWLWSDPNSLARFPEMAFGPGQAVMHPWLDDLIVSPWASMVGAPGAVGTVLTWRRNASQRTTQSMAAQNWSVRIKQKHDNTDTSTLGDSIDCVGYWGHASSWNTFNSFVWGTNVWDMTRYVDARATAVQLRVRLTDTQLCYMFGDPPPATLNPGPGPFLDRIRIGRRYVSGPVWNVGTDTRTLAQDCFPTEVYPGICCGEHFRPNSDTAPPLYPYLFGTCAFSNGADLRGGYSIGRLVTGDSISVSVTDSRNVGGITAVKWYGAIVGGPHAGKAPAPYAVGSNGFFEVQADSVKNAGAWVANAWCVDLDDTYFRGGDQLDYFWVADDAAGAMTTSPTGIGPGTFPPASVAAAEALTGGLYEVSFLPTIHWDAGYLARIAADPHGDLDPTANEVAGSSQQNCILYYQHSNSARRSGTAQRTSFMYTLDRLGYAGYYDVYDVQGYGNTNNQLGGRATVAQASGYALVIEDDGRSNLTPNVTDGSSDLQKVNQAQWYRDYLAQGASGRAGTASLWILGESTAYEKTTNALFTTYFGLASITNDQGLAVNPELAGVGTFTAWNNCSVPFTGDLFTLNGGCPGIRNYDTAAASGTAVVTHRFKSGATLGNGAVVMNKNADLHWNTVWMGFGWFDIRNTTGTPPGPDPASSFMQRILACLLSPNCQQEPGTTGNGGDPTDALPRVTALFQNTPNPFNPTTTIRFDLAHEGRVTLRIYDVAGRVVKTLIDTPLAPGRNLGAAWSGLTESGARAPSGVYFYRLVTDDCAATKKMVLMK